jgi:hypothetical protein
VQRFDLVFYNEASGCETFDPFDLVFYNEASGCETFDPIDLVFYNEASGCETFDPIDLVQGKVEDLLSAQLRDFSQQLTSLFLQYAVIGKELF